MVIIIQPAEQPRLALLQGLLPTPYINQRVRLIVVETVVRATVKRHQQQGPRLFGTNDRQQALNHPEHLLEMLAVAQNGIGRQQQGIQFATHHVALELQVAVLLQHLRGQGPILLRHPLHGMVTPKRLMKPRRNAVAVQPRVDVAVVGIQCNDLILPGLNREQRNIHAVLDADHHLLASGAGLDDDRGLYPLELSLGDADAVALHQPVGAGRVDRQHVGVRLGHPAQIAHRLVREIGIVLTVGIADARQEVVLGKKTLHAVNLAFGGMDEDVVVEQRPIRADQLAVTLVHLDIRRGKELKAGLSVTHPAIELLLQRAGRISLVMPVPGDRENQHIPTHGLAVLFGPKSAGDRIGPVPGVFAQSAMSSVVRSCGRNFRPKAIRDLAGEYFQLTDIQIFGFPLRLFVKILLSPVFPQPRGPQSAACRSSSQKSHVTAAKVYKMGLTTKNFS